MTEHSLVTALRAHEAEMIDIRHQIHRNPEVGFEETRTAALVAEKLRAFGIDVTEGIAKTGVVGTLKGRLPGQRAVGLRADLDALHIQEVPGRDYGSTVPGKMHACGHDGHTAMLLGAARYLSENPDFGGTVNFIFQPAEEGLGGGKKMVEEGLFEKFPVDAVYGMHNFPGVPVGHFGTRTGPFLAASDSWEVSFLGTGGHGGAGAHLATDATLPTAQFIMAVQTIVSRNVPAIETAVVSVGSIMGGDPGSPNIIPSKVTITGTARSYKPRIRDLMETRLTALAHAQAAAFGCTAEVIYNRRYPPLITHAEQTDISVAAASELVGAAQVDGNVPAVTGSEDFSFMLEAKPGGFIIIGNGVASDGSFHNVHTPGYDFNDDILALGAAYWVKLVHTELAVGA
ncbi:amidohydrolase [Bradyrhizobium sp. LTSPM299]|uniref:M20 aminoacylase family protein n=1 Tax=Bradyrhizobium sp. LTSPM299 TaxID=1619233 RepID=UPI0005CA5487|nr:M20 aminoacylase family protein [Bradyrhizobium sp. LTSPM299]KJC57461.1 amidohydrolase [Bradyrhizobium sp. LTSPM299]